MLITQKEGLMSHERLASSYYRIMRDESSYLPLKIESDDKMHVQLNLMGKIIIATHVKAKKKKKEAAIIIKLVLSMHACPRAPPDPTWAGCWWTDM